MTAAQILDTLARADAPAPEETIEIENTLHLAYPDSADAAVTARLARELGLPLEGTLTGQGTAEQEDYHYYVTFLVCREVA